MRMKPFKKTDWREVGDKDNVIAKIHVGNMEKDTEVIPVIVDMYREIWEKVQKEGYYKVYFDISNTPVIVITDSGKLVEYNENIQLFAEDIKEAINQTKKSEMYKAALDFIMNENGKKLGEAAKDYVQLIRKKTEADYSNSFIFRVIMDVISNKYIHSKTADLVKCMNLECLLSSIVGIMEYQSEGICDIEPVSTFLKTEQNPEHLEKLIYQEAAVRFLNLRTENQSMEGKTT